MVLFDADGLVQIFCENRRIPPSAPIGVQTEVPAKRTAGGRAACANKRAVGCESSVWCPAHDSANGVCSRHRTESTGRADEAHRSARAIVDSHTPSR